MNLILSKIPVAVNNQNHNSGPLKIFLKAWYTFPASINSLEMSGHIKYLKMIDAVRFEPGVLNILTNSKVQLKFLSMEPYSYHIYHANNDDRQIFTNEIYQFLQQQIYSLEILKYETEVFKFPSFMPILKELHLIYVSGFAGIGGIAQSPISYHQYFPNLQILLIRPSILQFEFPPSAFILQFLSPQEPCLSLKKLSIHITMQSEIMKKISSIFPQIKSLTIGFMHLSHIEENLLYSEIWNSSFSETLEELYLELDKKKYVQNELMDTYMCMHHSSSDYYSKLNCLFSGMEEDQIHTLDNSISTMTFNNYELDETKYNSILKFKNLKTLKIICYSLQRYPFTDFSAFYIFGNMKKLQVLHLDEKLRRFSAKALKYLRNKKCLSSSSQVQRLAIQKNNAEMLFPINWKDSIDTKNTFNLLDKIKVKRNVVDVHTLRIKKLKIAMKKELSHEHVSNHSKDEDVG